MTRRGRIVFVALLFSMGLKAQDASQQLLKVTPPSPNVASLGKYGEIPVSMYTGVPEISIPIYQIHDGPLTVPISISYHAGGIKVEEMSSSVGLGWTLNAGGAIGRNVRGIADELGQWRSQPVSNQIETIYNSGNTSQINQMLQEISLGTRDGEADMYYYNFSQGSGRFFFDQSGNAYTQPLKNFLFSSLSDGWQIITDDGTKYQFNKREEVDAAGCSMDQITTTAWFLTSIKSSDGAHEISFTYETAFYTYPTLSAQVKNFWVNGTAGGCVTNAPPCITSNNYRTFRLIRIDFTGGYVKFNYNTIRSDLVDDKSLDQIEIYSGQNLMKKINLDHSYFGNNSDGPNRLTETRKRLKLVSVTEVASDDSSNPPYQFEYNESVALPDRLSYSQDHWGYFNGENNSDLIATFSSASSGHTVTYAGANRRTNPAKAQAAILKKITYPTGGETLFTFESNAVSDNRVELQTTQSIVSLSASNQLVSSFPIPFESTELVIPDGGAMVNFSNISGFNSLWQGCDIVQCYVIKDNSSTYFRQIGDNLNGGSEFWPAGTYKLRVITECGAGVAANFSASLTADIPVFENLVIRPVGGLRVSRIEDRPNPGLPIVKNYRYTKENDASHSSGVLMNFPDYGYEYRVTSATFDEYGVLEYTPVYCFYNVRQSFSNYPLATTQGSYVGYQYVTVDFNGNGESRYTYNVNPGLQSAFPFAPVENYDWMQGSLAKQEDLALDNGQLKTRRVVMNGMVALAEKRVYGLKVGSNDVLLENGAMNPSHQPAPIVQHYPTITQTFDIGTATERLYDQNNDQLYVERKTEYEYNPIHFQMTKVTAATSKSNSYFSEELVTYKKYPGDFVFSGTPVGPEAEGLKRLQDLHVVNAIIEEEKVKRLRELNSNEITDERVLNGSIVTFLSAAPYRNKLVRLESAQPIPIAEYGLGSTLLNNVFLTNANSNIATLFQPKIIFNNYDLKGNILSQQKSDDVKEVFLWGYNSQYPVAKVVGSDFAAVSAVINNQSLIDNPIDDASLRSYLNLLRTDPRTNKALTFTYTYKPLIGITSETDPSGTTTYYEYDAFNRLKSLKDNDGNVIKTFQYKYNEQQ